MAYRLGRKFTEEGVWREYINGGSFLIARSGNTTYLKEKEKLERPVKKRIEKGTLGIEKQIKIVQQAMSVGIVLDWKNVEDEDGKAIKYTPELGLQAMEEDDELFEFITDVAADNENFRVAQVEETAKKLQKVSSG